MLCVYCIIGCFFVKLNTAYEVRIGDWRSNVCSADLKLSFVASLFSGGMLVRLPLLALAGTLAGLLLGETIAKPLAAVRGGAGPASYAQYSANHLGRAACRERRC